MAKPIVLSRNTCVLTRYGMLRVVNFNKYNNNYTGSTFNSDVHYRFDINDVIHIINEKELADGKLEE